MMNIKTCLVVTGVVSGIAALPLSVRGAVVPFVEEFVVDSADWRNADGTAALTWIPAGGPDGSSYAQGTFNFLSSADGDDVTVLRAQDEFDSSGGAFVGNYLTEGVAEFRAYVRHFGPEPMTFFVRFSGPSNFPGAIAVNFVPVFPGQWTEIVVPINATNPQFVSFEGQDFNTVFSNVGHVQLGVSVSATLAGVDLVIPFEVDKATLVEGPPVPAASEWGLLGTALLGLIGGTLIFRRGAA